MRARSLLVLLMFIPPWIVMSVTTILNPTYEDLTALLSSRAVGLVTFVVAILLIGGYFASETLMRYLLRRAQLQERIVDYAFEYNWQPSFMLVYVISMGPTMQPLVIHLALQQLGFLSDYLLLQASFFVIVLGFIGVFLVFYEPESYDMKDKRDFVTYILVLGVSLGFVFLPVSLLIVGITLWQLKKRSDKAGSIDYHFHIQSSLQKVVETTWIEKQLENYEGHEFLAFSVFVIFATSTIVAFLLNILELVDYITGLALYLIPMGGFVVLVYLIPKYLVKRKGEDIEGSD